MVKVKTYKQPYLLVIRPIRNSPPQALRARKARGGHGF